MTALPGELFPNNTRRTGATTYPAGPWRVLLAEDDRTMRELIASILTGEGYEVIEASDGSELIAHLQDVARQPHGRETLALIISDVRMPRLDGLDLLAALRCARWYTPVILITAFADDRTRRDAHDFGAVAVLDKPFSLATLQALVHQIAPQTSCDRQEEGKIGSTEPGRPSERQPSRVVGKAKRIARARPGAGRGAA